VESVVVELKPLGQFWQVTRNGTVLACAIDRRGAINVAARLLRPETRNPESLRVMCFVGLELAELERAESVDPNWRHKGPRIELDLFEAAERYLQVELVPADEIGLIAEYRQALTEDHWDTALECLVQLGERQQCSNPFWKLVERLADALWQTAWMVDRRERGQGEAKVAAIKQRAKGRA